MHTAHLFELGTGPPAKRLRVTVHTSGAGEVMTNAEQQLARIGFGGRPSERTCWRVTRLDQPHDCKAATAAEHSPALMRWRVLLARDSRRPPYRISRLGS